MKLNILSVAVSFRAAPPLTHTYIANARRAACGGACKAKTWRLGPKIRALAISIGILAAPAVPASAALKTLDFENYQVVGLPGAGYGFYYANVISDGARLSPSCHIHINPGSLPGGYNNSTWISWDASGCPSARNPDYLGDPNAAADLLYLDFFEQPFTLKSFHSADFRFHVFSSKGGQQATDFLKLIEFDGSEWTNISWLVFDCQCGAPSPGIDHLTVEISEPHPVVQIAMGLLFLYFIRSRVLRESGCQAKV